MNVNDTHRLDTDLSQRSSLTPRRVEKHDGGSAANTSLPNVDKLFLNNLRPQQATDFLAQHINRRLDERFQLSPVQLPNFVGLGQGPGSAAGQILQRANQAFHQLASGAGITNAAQRVRDEVDQGYNDAMDIFNVFGNIQQKTREDLNKVRELLDRAYQSAPLNGDEAETQQLYLDNQSYSSTTSSSLQIETADGDIITIDLSHSVSRSSSNVQYTNDDGELSYRENSNSESLEIAINVQGNLSDDEKAAIGDLVTQLTKVTRLHDNGNEQGALNNAAKIDFDNNLIKAFDYQHTVDETVENVSVSEGGNPLAVDTPQVANVVQEFSFLPFKDMRMAVNALLEKIAEFRASLDEALLQKPTTQVKEEA